MNRIYCGIGSRHTPAKVLKQMTWLGEALAEKDWILRSGAADGADAAFEQGCNQSDGTCEIYLPWQQFNGSTSELHAPSPRAYAIARQYHPNWNNLSVQARSFMARNTEQILGEYLYEPSTMIVCWTPDGAENGAETSIQTGGTGQAIRVASAFNIPIFNLKNSSSSHKLVEFINQI